MYNADTKTIVIFIIICTILILLLSGFITYIIYRYQQKQNAYFKNLEEIKISHENIMLKSMIEIQEQTFSNISREIHDNIGQKLTLAKLHLNTLDLSNISKLSFGINESISMVGEAIEDLSDISRSMSSEIILNSGFIKALEFEVNQLNKTGLYNIKLYITGNTIFMEANKELILFRITQEALNNIVKHAEATNIVMRLHYKTNTVSLEIEDNGKGQADIKSKPGNGLINMDRRAQMLNGSFNIKSEPGIGTIIKIEIPLYENNNIL